MLLQDRTHLTAPFLGEDWGLKTERRQDDLVAPTGAGCLFRCVHELRAIALSAQVCVDPEVLDVTTATPRSAMESCQPLPRLVFYLQSQIGAIVIPRLCDVVGVQLVFQKRAVVERGMCLDLHRISLHG